MVSIQGFPNGFDLCWGDNLGKMAKNCMKITKSTFLCEIVHYEKSSISIFKESFASIDKIFFFG